MPRCRLLTIFLCFLTAVFALPQTAQTQGPLTLYYAEEEREGRVYVFNTPEAHKEFLTSGEMGKSITLIGRAVDGKTLVAENEIAANLYLFKHNLPAYAYPTPAPYKPPFDVSWKDGKTTIQSKNAQLVISNRLQVRFTSEDLGSSSTTSKPERDSFRIRRFKTKFDGWVYSKNLTYELQMNWPDTANPLEDANVNYDFTNGKKQFMIKFGQYKVPFGRQELTSSGSQQFVDRAAVSNIFARGRDIGLQLWGTPNNGIIDWRVGVFNGNGRTVSRNDNDDLQLNARLQWAPFGDPKYSESDFEGTEKFLFAVAGNYEQNTREVPAAGQTPAHQNQWEILGLDVIAKYRGFSLFAEHFSRSNDRNKNLRDFDDEGTTIQAGYFVIPSRLELALRASEYDPDTAVGNNEQLERGFAVSYYWNKHDHKLQADFRELEDKARRNTDREIRIQYQLIF